MSVRQSVIRRDGSRRLQRTKRYFGDTSTANQSRYKNSTSSREAGPTSSSLSESIDSRRSEFIHEAHQIDERFGYPRLISDSSSPVKCIGWLFNMQSTVILANDPTRQSSHSKAANPVTHDPSDTTPSLQPNVVTASCGKDLAAVDFYFIHDSAQSTFKATVPYSPYFLIGVRSGRLVEVEDWLLRTFSTGSVNLPGYPQGPATSFTLIRNVRRILRQDLNLPNHLIGLHRILLKLEFYNVSDLLAVRKVLLPLVERNRKSFRDGSTSGTCESDILREISIVDASGTSTAAGAFNDISLKEIIDTGLGVSQDPLLNLNSMSHGYDTIHDFFESDLPYSLHPASMAHKQARDPNSKNSVYRNTSANDPSSHILDIREYDVPYHVRVAIDMNIRVGKWYSVTTTPHTTLTCLEDRLAPADPIVLAFDIETTKLPLKFPDASFDQIMMISYMIDAQGFLITNRSIISMPIADFEYTPKPEFEGPFIVFNEPDEKAVIERFFQHIQLSRPQVIVTYNGDFFDWPFVEARAAVHGLDMYREIGFRKNTDDVYQSNFCAHLDAFAWVNRDSYLPQGSRGLKAVTVAKLGYDPDELDPELMTPYATEQPQTLAEYSVSDAVATYYLYMKYVHPFIFSLCTIVPLGPDDVLRKGTGTLCEMLLMVQAYEKNILLPNKHVEARENFWDGHLLESETYVGGHVESIESGVFRHDLPYQFHVDTTAIDELLDNLDAALKFSITVEEKKSMQSVSNYEQVREEIADKLRNLRNNPDFTDCPILYHLDVASMYPNIMTTNRLQPDSMVSPSDCAACDFNVPGKKCDRRLAWSWRGEFLPAKRDEYNMIRTALQSERFPGKHAKDPPRSFHELSADEQADLVKKRLREYCRKIYRKIHETCTQERESIVCQRENPFYVDTVRQFRDRRYDFKGKQRHWKGVVDKLKQSGAPLAEIDEARKMIIVYDSLQLAHKVILNSFYGYVMRKGSRWHSLEMAGITCLTGARIIQMARSLIERIGRPLELDTDGIWCILPKGFPENFVFSVYSPGDCNGSDVNPKKLKISYPCVMLNYLVHAQFTNTQYQTLKDAKSLEYETHSENSIFFEVDGPYRAMILPTSKEEDKNLKKRYAVFNFDGSLAELKGFEVKRRGELKLVKIFQTQIFKFFLEGNTLNECYQAVASVANRWLDVLYQRGRTMVDDELISLICENKSMTKTLEEYGTQKSTAITTARRLAEFLGEQMVKNRGLNCRYIISALPRNAPVAERAVPVAIFSAEPHVCRHFLRKWLREDVAVDDTVDPRAVIDWDYYLERLGSVIQKLIAIPAALQGLDNPVPRVAHPDWLERRIRAKNDTFKQKKMTELLATCEKPVYAAPGEVPDVEDLHGKKEHGLASKKFGHVTKVRQKRKVCDVTSEDTIDPYTELPPIMPDITQDYVSWLQYQKRKWAIQQEARIRRRKVFGNGHEVRLNGKFRLNGETNDTREFTSGGDVGEIGRMFQNQFQRTFAQHPWQIVQVYESEVPGNVQAMIVLDDGATSWKRVQMHCITIRVPRIIYINFKTATLPHVDIKQCKVEKLPDWTLPHGPKCGGNLFRLTMPERVYRDESKQIAALFKDPNVEGVYETQLPLSMRALLELGSHCRLNVTNNKGSLMTWDNSKTLENGFDMAMLKRLNAPAAYLRELTHSNDLRHREGKSQNLVKQLHFIYLYHVQSAGRQVYLLCSSTVGLGSLIVQAHKGAKLDDMGGLPATEKIYSEAWAKYWRNISTSGERGETWRGILKYPERLSFTNSAVNTGNKALVELANALKRVQSAVSQWSDEVDGNISSGSSSAIVLVVQSAQAGKLVRTLVRGNNNKLATLELNVEEADGKWPALGWMKYSVNRGIGHFFALSAWLEYLARLAAFGNIPLCNLMTSMGSGGDPRFVIDVLYARRLSQSNVVLWWSEAALPDYGGHERNEVLGLMDSVDDLVINTPGAQRSVSVDIMVRNLTIASLLAISLGTSMQNFGVSNVGMLGEGGDNLHDVQSRGSWNRMDEDMEWGGSEDILSFTGIGVLKDLVRDWWAMECMRVKQQQQGRNKDNLDEGSRTNGSEQMADVMVQHLYRWASSRESFLYDSKLHYYVRMVGRKALQQLLLEIRRLGGSIVFGSSQRVIVRTNKRQVMAARGYVDYLIRTVQAKEMFAFLHLEVGEYWEYLLWLDRFNYGGISFGDETNVSKLGEVNGDNIAVEGKTVLCWQMGKLLPSHVQATFVQWIVEFIRIMWDRVKQQRMGIERGEKNVEGNGENGASKLANIVFESLTKDEGKGVERDEELPNKFKERMIRELEGLVRRVNEKENKPIKIGKLPGSWTRKKEVENAGLWLVKTVLQIMSLEAELSMDLLKLRKTALIKCQVSEFSELARWEVRWASWPLEVICDECGSGQIVDLCRDVEVVLVDYEYSEGEEGDGSGKVGKGGRVLGQSLPRFTCDFCGIRNDMKLRMEEALVRQVEEMLLMWYIQDVKCAQCGRIKANDFMVHCPCSGKQVWISIVGGKHGGEFPDKGLWEGSNREDVDNRERRGMPGKIKVLRDIASWFDMEILANVISEMEEMCLL